jgi:hypothetical protein
LLAIGRSNNKSKKMRKRRKNKMDTGNRREEMKRALQKRTERDYQKGGTSQLYSDIFKKIEGLQKFKCGEGPHLVDILEYVAGDKDTDVETKAGDLTYVLHIWVHQKVGVGSDTFVCPAYCYKQPCPICEYREKMRADDDYDEDAVKSLYPKHRNIYNIICYDNPKEEAKGIQIWDVADFFIGEKLRSLSKKADRGGKGGGYIYYADAEEGKSIKFERKGSGQQNTQFLGHQFVERDYIISEDFLKSAYQLDQIIEIPTYQELSNAFFGTPMETAPPQEQPEELPQEPVRHSPVRSKEGLTKVVAGRQCPAGGRFGIDCERLEECASICDIWDDCSAEKDSMRAKEVAKQPKEVIANQLPKEVVASRQPKEIVANRPHGPAPIIPRRSVR